MLLLKRQLTKDEIRALNAANGVTQITTPGCFVLVLAAGIVWATILIIISILV